MLGMGQPPATPNLSLASQAAPAASLGDPLVLALLACVVLLATALAYVVWATHRAGAAATGKRGAAAPRRAASAAGQAAHAEPQPAAKAKPKGNPVGGKTAKDNAEAQANRFGLTSSAFDEDRMRDPLTSLITRPEFEILLDDAANKCDRSGQRVAVLCIGLDNFRAINASYGHQVGDALLCETAERLSAFVGDKPYASRVSGDEFTVLIKADEGRASDAAAKLLAKLQAPFVIDGMDLRVTASIGIAVYPDHGARQRLLAHAALAMRTVKLGGGAGHAQFDVALGVDVREQADMLQDLRHAIERQQLQLYYQPKIDARSLQVTAAEALLRWAHPTRGMVPPAIFIPLAERHGLICEIGSWVLEEACRQAAMWRTQGLRMRVAVNISGHQLRQDKLVAQIEDCLSRHSIKPSRLTCEITESVAMEDTAHTRAAFDRLKRAGLHVSIDDFGTGHSSLASLQKLPAAELKIDRAFVIDLGTSAKAKSIVQAIVQMAHSLNLRVVAEGVETEAQRDVLLELGADELQGYLFAKPMSAQSLALWADDDRKGGQATAFRASLFGTTGAMPL
jgi:diguanylate cyclase